MNTLDNKKNKSNIPMNLIEEGYTKNLGQIYVCKDCNMYFKEDGVYVLVSKPNQEDKRYVCETCKVKKSVVKVTT